jgi:hypothetical protein
MKIKKIKKYYYLKYFYDTEYHIFDTIRKTGVFRMGQNRGMEAGSARLADTVVIL